MRNPKDIFVHSYRERLLSGVIDRRQFLSGLVSSGVSLPLALSYADDVLARTPKRGGSLRIGISQGSTTDTLEPGTSIVVGWLFGNSLTEVNNRGELVSELAESYDSSDAKTWTFKLRRGVEFHNGKSLTSDDVISSLNYHRGDASKSAAKSVVGGVFDIRKDGAHTVIFELTEPDADFPYKLSDYHLLILPEVSPGAIDVLGGIGTGGYMIDDFEPGVRLTARRNPNYWKSGSAWFDSVEVISITDTTARQTALLNGDVDVIDRVDTKTVSLLSRDSGVEIIESVGTKHYTFPMRLDVPPFDNYDLRMALKLAVNRQELVTKILFGYGSLGNDSPLSPVANRYAARTIPQREFDSDRALFHYRRSGHAGRLPLSASDAAFTGAVDASQLIASSASSIGIDVDVIREPADGYWDNVWNKKGWCACIWSGRPTADWMFTSAYTDDTAWNDTAWVGTDDSKRFNVLVREARSELDDSRRRELYEEAQLLLHDDGGALIPMFASNVEAASRRLGHSAFIGSNWELDGGKLAERWWFT